MQRDNARRDSVAARLQMNREGEPVHNRLLVAISLVAIALLPHRAIAQTFACQYIAEAGLKWESGGWQSTRFKVDKPFFLKMDGEDLDLKVVADVLGSTGASSEEVRCTKLKLKTWRRHSCIDGFGSLIFFNDVTATGGRALIAGAIDTRDTRDTLSVAPFTCQKM
jgi:hypothetical protein